MFDRLVNQLAGGTPRVSDNWHNDPNKRTARSIAIKMRDVKTGEILNFVNFSRAGRHFGISDLRIIRGLIDNPERSWRGYQAKLQEDTTKWVPVSEVYARSVRTFKNLRKNFYVVTFIETGVEHLCAGYSEAEEVTGMSPSYLSKIVCYGGKLGKVPFRIRPANQSDVDRLQTSNPSNHPHP